MIIVVKKYSLLKYQVLSNDYKHNSEYSTSNDDKY